MKQKIEWYREVLEIEPNSKVFFPLARVLVADKQIDEAISVLSAGLSRHPYFIEARLLLVELLFAGGKQDNLWHEVDMVSSMLGGYPSFWRAWAERLSRDSGSLDAALAVSFVAASLQKIPISWAEVIEHGLRACFTKHGLNAPLPEHSGALAPPVVVPVVSATPAHDQPVHDQLVHDQGADQEPCPSCSNLSSEDFNDVEGELASESPDSFSANVTEGLSEDISASLVAAEMLDDGETDLAADLSSGSLSAPATLAGLSDSLLEVSADVAPEPEERVVPDSFVPELSVQTDLPQELEHDDDEELEGEEQYSLHTRSMAGILADQGDFLGARNIYLELMSSADSEVESLELKECADEMLKKSTSQGQVEQTAKPLDESAATPGIRMNEQVMSKLKTLVDRLESRSLS